MSELQRSRFQFTISDYFFAVGIDESRVRVDLVRVVREKEIPEVFLRRSVSLDVGETGGSAPWPRIARVRTRRCRLSFSACGAKRKSERNW